MAPRLQFTQTQLNDMERVVSIDNANVDAMAKAISNSSETVLVRKMVRHAAYEVAENLEKEIDALVDVVFGLGAFCNATGTTKEEVVDLVTEALKKSDWIADDIEKWKSRSNSILAILRSDAVHAGIKAQGLVYEYRNTLHSTRVMTDVRPVFDQTKTEMIGGIISQTLRIEYHEDYSTKSLNITLGSEELDELVDELQKAKTKAKKAKEKLEVSNVFALELGDEFYGP